MCKELNRTAAEAEAEAAASILVELSVANASWPQGPGAVATARTTMPDSIAGDALTSFCKIRALCAAVNLVNSTLRLVSLCA